MKYALFASYAALVVLAAVLLYTILKRDGKQSEKQKVLLPDFCGVIGFVGAVLFHIPMTAIAFGGGGWRLFISFFAFVCLGASLMIGRINCRIEYDESGFTVTNFIGLRRYYTYNDFTGKRQSFGKTVLYVKGRKLRIDDIAVGEEEFIDFARKQYRIRNGGSAVRTLPEIEIKGAFRKNVNHPGEFIFVYCTILLITVGVLASLVFMYFNTTEESELEYMTVTIRNVEKYHRYRQSGLRAVTNDTDVLLALPFSERLLKDDPALIERLTAGGERYRIGYEIKGTDENIYYSIDVIIAEDGEELLSFERTERYKKENILQIIVLFSGLGILNALWFLLTVRIGRHPEKYSRRVKRMFFRDGYIR